VSTPVKTFEQGEQRQAATLAGQRIVPLVSAIIAVLAALGSLFAHHKSIQALAIKNQAIHAGIKASDQYAYYQAKRMRVSEYRALIDAGVVRDAKALATMKKVVDREEIASLSVLGDARSQESAAEAQEDRSQIELQSFQTFEIAATLFEISIVLVSISALTSARARFWTSCGISAIGIVLLLVAYVQGR
jgi:hypothetical protein